MLLPLFQKSDINWTGFLIKWLFLPLLLAVIAWSVSHWMADNKPQPKERPNRVKKVKVFVKQTEQDALFLIGHSQGQVLPKDILEIRSEVAGKISYLSPDLVAGGLINQGDVLVKINSQDYELEVIQKRARVAQAEQQMIRAEAEAQAAQQEIKALGRKNVSSLALGLPQLKQAEAALSSAKAELSIAELALSRTQIIAPFNAIIESEALTVGQYINRSGILLTLFSTEIMEVRLPMTTQQFTQIGLPLAYYANYDNSQFKVTLSARIGVEVKQWHAKIVRTESVIDDKTQSVYAVAEVRNSYGDQKNPLLKGLFVNAQITGQLANDVSVLPKSALRSNQQLWTVNKENELKILDADIVQRTPDAIIVKNLPNNSLVITSALAIPTEGMPVLPIIEGSLKVANRKAKSTSDNQIATEGVAVEKVNQTSQKRKSQKREAKKLNKTMSKGNANAL